MISDANYSDFDRAFESAIRNKDQRLALAFIKHGITQRSMSQNLRSSISSRLSSVTLEMMDRGADFSVEPGLGLGTSVLRTAIAHGDQAVMTDILTRDPDHLRREDKHDSLLHAALTTKKQEASGDMLNFLFANGLEVERFENNGITYLVDAIKRPRPSLLKLLINHGANPNTLYQGQSLVEVAQQYPSDSSDEILTILNTAGVAKTAFALTNSKKDLAKYKKCNFDQASFDFTDKNHEFGSALIQLKSLNRIQRCEGLILACRKSGQDLDSCIYSAPICSTDSAADELCCDTSFKNTYTEARCAGLPAEHAVFRIDGITTQHTVPVLLADPNRRRR